jgi:hypothetical protein
MRNQYKVLQEAYEQVIEEATPPGIEDQVVDAFTQGFDHDIKELTTSAGLGKKFNLSPNTIRRILKRRGLSSFVNQGQKISGGQAVYAMQRLMPDQIEYINNLIRKREENDPWPYAYSAEVIKNMSNDYAKNHPELNWYIILGKETIQTTYIKDYQEELGYPRSDVGIRTANGSIFYTPRRTKPNVPFGPPDPNAVIDPKAANRAGTRQQSFGALGPNDPSYNAVMGRAQNINETNA